MEGMARAVFGIHGNLLPLVHTKIKASCPESLNAEIFRI